MRRIWGGEGRAGQGRAGRGGPVDDNVWLIRQMG